MEIKHPRRLLLVCAPNCDALSLLKDLTGTAPPASAATTDSIAGLTHEWTIKTAYYSANIPIWIDVIADLSQWQSEFLTPEAKEVVQAVGGWIYYFPVPGTGNGAAGAAAQESEIQVVEDTMAAIEDIVEKACGYAWEGTRLAVAAKASPTAGHRAARPELDLEVWEDRCTAHSFEFVDSEATGKNEFGEAVGLVRVKEALMTNDWAQQLNGGAGEELFGGLEDEEGEMNAELWGLKASLLGLDEGVEDDNGFESTQTGGMAPGDEALEVDDMERLMSQALAIKESGSDLPLEERKRFAARAVNDLMKTM